MDSANGNSLVTICRCKEDHDIMVPLSENNLLALSPTVFQDGWAYYRALSFEPDGLKKLFADVNA